LFDGQSFILVPESAWLNELKSNPCGVTAVKSLEDSLLSKGWIKLRSQQDPNSHGSEGEWMFEETGTRMKIAVNPDGQLTVNGAPVGSTTTGEAVKVLQKAAEDATGKWITVPQEIRDAAGSPVIVKRRVFIPADKQRKPPGFEPGKDARKPGDITRIGSEKGGPHPTADILGSKVYHRDTAEDELGIKNMTHDAMSQLIGTYRLPVLKESPSKEEMLRRCNTMLELAGKEENDDEKRRLLEQVDKELMALESMAKGEPDAKKIGDKLGVDWGKTDLKQFQMGMKEELEHKDVTGGDPEETGKIVLAHLKEKPDYYTRLNQIMGGTK
jgi:hypothetical protein